MINNYYFWAALDHFWSKHPFRGSWVFIKNWLKPTTKAPQSSLAYTNSWNAHSFHFLLNYSPIIYNTFSINFLNPLKYNNRSVLRIQYDQMNNFSFWSPEWQLLGHWSKVFSDLLRRNQLWNDGEKRESDPGQVARLWKSSNQDPSGKCLGKSSFTSRSVFCSQYLLINQA